MISGMIKRFDKDPRVGKNGETSRIAGSGPRCVCMQVRCGGEGRGGEEGGETSGEIRLKTRLLSGAVLKLARWLVAVLVVAAERD